MRRILQAAKLWFFVVALSFFIIMGSITIHEAGHAAAAIIAGCSVQSISLYYQGGHPTTDILCKSSAPQTFVALGGITLNIIFAIVFLIPNKRFINNIAVMFFGFGLYSAKMDLESIGFSSLFGSFISIAGIIIMTYALYLICNLELESIKGVA